MPEIETVGGGCECWVVPEHLWTTHYGAVEPGSAVEHNPDCPQHRTPYRIQRRRTKGWRMPPNTVYVGRGSKWGNPWRVGNGNTPAIAVGGFRKAIERGGYLRDPDDSTWHAMPTPEQIRTELRGKNLACWCPLDQPCHADVLLELANRDTPTGAPE